MGLLRSQTLKGLESLCAVQLLKSNRNEQDNRVPMIGYPFLKREPIGTWVQRIVIE